MTHSVPWKWQVHFNVKYKNFDAASRKSDGLLVIGILFDNHDSDYEPLNGITKKLHQVEKEGSEVRMSDTFLRLGHFIPKFDETFYLYKGSLTTPPCTESVTWIIFPQLLTVSTVQLDTFQKLDNKENHYLGNTYRKEQPLNGRKVFASSDDFCN